MAAAGATSRSRWLCTCMLILCGMARRLDYAVVAGERRNLDRLTSPVLYAVWPLHIGLSMMTSLNSAIHPLSVPCMAM